MAAKKPAKAPDAKETKVGTVEHYYGKVQAAAVGLEGDLKVGDTIHIKGATDDVTKKVTSMQMDHVPIQEGHKGQHVGVQVPTKVHDNSAVFKVVKGAVKPAAKPATKAPAKKPAAKPKKKAAKKPKRKAAKKGRKASTKRAGARKTAKAGRKKAKRGAKKGGRKAAKRGKKSARRGKKAK